MCIRDRRMIEDAFKDWIFKDRERRESLVALYNEKFNCIRPREYDGSHIQFFGMNPEIALRPHQRNAIAHIDVYKRQHRTSAMEVNCLFGKDLNDDDHLHHLS